MEKGILVISKKIKNMDSGYIFGQLQINQKHMQECGRKEKWKDMEWYIKVIY